MSVFYRKPFGIIGNGPAIFVAMFVLMFLTWNVPQVHAQTASNTFDLWINRDVTHLPSYEGTPSTGNMFGWRIDAMNNKPYLELKNDATSPLPITEFRMTIGNELYHFGALGSELIKIASAPSGVDITSSVEALGNELVLKFGGTGLMPDDFVHFQINLDLDSCPSCGQPSFQTVLFNMSPNGVSNGEKSKVTVTYNPVLGPTSWGSFPVNPHVDGNYVPYGQSAMMNSPMGYQFSSGPPDVTDPGGGDPDIPLLPEPGSGCLAIVGLVVAWSTSRSRR